MQRRVYLQVEPAGDWSDKMSRAANSSLINKIGILLFFTNFTIQISIRVLIPWGPHGGYIISYYFVFSIQLTKDYGQPIMHNTNT